MRSSFPVLTLLTLIVALWYACVPLANIRWEIDQATRAETAVNIPALAGTPVLGAVALVLANPALVPATFAQERPVLPALHQVGAELWKGLAGQAPTSKRSLIYHGYVTLTATFWGFVLGTALGCLMAVVIVRSRLSELALMPWAVISQTIPVVAIAPIIVVLSNRLGIGEQIGVENHLVSKTIIAAYLSYFPVLVGMVKGLRAPDQMQLDLLRTYGASQVQTFRLLRLPASMPYLFASLKVGVAASLLGAIVGELPTGAIEGLGARMQIGSQFGAPLVVWSALFATAILAGLLVLVLRLAEAAINRKMGARP